MTPDERMKESTTTVIYFTMKKDRIIFKNQFEDNLADPTKIEQHYQVHITLEIWNLQGQSFCDLN